MEKLNRRRPPRLMSLSDRAVKAMFACLYSAFVVAAFLSWRSAQTSGSDKVDANESSLSTIDQLTFYVPGKLKSPYLALSLSRMGWGASSIPSILTINGTECPVNDTQIYQGFQELFPPEDSQQFPGHNLLVVHRLALVAPALCKRYVVQLVSTVPRKTYDGTFRVDGPFDLLRPLEYEWQNDSFHTMRWVFMVLLIATTAYVAFRWVSAVVTSGVPLGMQSAFLFNLAALLQCDPASLVLNDGTSVLARVLVLMGYNFALFAPLWFAREILVDLHRIETPSADRHSRLSRSLQAKEVQSRSKICAPCRCCCRCFAFRSCRCVAASMAVSLLLGTLVGAAAPFVP